MRCLHDEFIPAQVVFRHAWRDVSFLCDLVLAQAARNK